MAGISGLASSEDYRLSFINDVTKRGHQVVPFSRLYVRGAFRGVSPQPQSTYGCKSLGARSTARIQRDLRIDGILYERK